MPPPPVTLTQGQQGGTRPQSPFPPSGGRPTAPPPVAPRPPQTSGGLRTGGGLRVPAPPPSQAPPAAPPAGGPASPSYAAPPPVSTQGFREVDPNNMSGWSGGAGTGGGLLPPSTPGASPGASAPTTLTNTSADSPLLQEQVGLLRERLGADTISRAIDRSNLGIADSAALLAKDRKANLSSRGISGTSAADAYLDKNVFNPAQAQAAGAAADITMDAERRKDALVLGGSSIFRAPDELNLANRRINLDQFSAQSGDQRARAALELDAQRQREDIERSRYQAMQTLNEPPAAGAPPAGGGGIAPPVYRAGSLRVGIGRR